MCNEFLIILCVAEETQQESLRSHDHFALECQQSGHCDSFSQAGGSYTDPCPGCCAWSAG